MADDPSNSRELGFYFALAQVGTEMVLPLVIGAILDHYFNWSPWGVVIGALIGFIGGLAHLLFLVLRHEAEDRKRSGRDGV